MHKLLAVLFLVLISEILNRPPRSTKLIQPAVPSPSPSSTVSTRLEKVTRVLDGDTIETETGQRVRYIGIDAPELHHPKKSAQCFGQEAMRKNKELVEGKIVALEKDVSDVDRYGRLLRYIRLASGAAEIFINDFLVKEGYAYAATFPPDVRFAGLFRQSQNQAIKNQKGLWKTCL